MTIDAIGFLPPVAMPSLAATMTTEPTATSAAGAMAAPSGQFAAWFGQQLAETNHQLLNADQGVQQLAAGDAANLHQVMINLEQAKLSMQMVMQVRNHLLDAYHELLQMQV
jgi:flagellar hook-basal body complex protein FliE